MGEAAVPDDLRGEAFVVTGATSGIGRAVATALACRGAHVLLACRSADRADAVVAEITAATADPGRAEHVPLDLADLTSVHACAREVLSHDRPVRGLINNAGVAGGRGATAQGFELAFGVNHLGHFLLTALLLDRLRESRPARVVTMASVSHRSVPSIDYDAVTRPTKTFIGLREYAVSKFANVLFTQELARREHDRGVTAFAVDPGSVASDIWRRIPGPLRTAMKWPMRSPDAGARSPVHCATAPGIDDDTGGYWVVGRRRRPSRFATEARARELWERSEQWVSVPIGNGR
jgi:retinol dehydrogenase-12